MKTALLLPVKPISTAKQRLSRWLDPSSRVRLMRAMLLDTVQALEGAAAPTALFVVTSDPLLDRYFRRRGWCVFMESTPLNESASVDAASARLQAEGYEAVLRVPADLPNLRAEDIDKVLSESNSRGCSIIVPSSDRQGTNALLRTPPLGFPARFGPNSLHLHLQESVKAQRILHVLEVDGFALDIDTPEDIVLFLRSRPRPSHTLNCLRELDLLNRWRNNPSLKSN